MMGAEKPTPFPDASGEPTISPTESSTAAAESEAAKNLQDRQAERLGKPNPANDVSFAEGAQLTLLQANQILNDPNLSEKERAAWASRRESNAKILSLVRPEARFNSKELGQLSTIDAQINETRLQQDKLKAGSPEFFKLTDQRTSLREQADAIRANKVLQVARALHYPSADTLSPGVAANTVVKDISLGQEWSVAFITDVSTGGSLLAQKAILTSGTDTKIVDVYSLPTRFTVVAGKSASDTPAAERNAGGDMTVEREAEQQTSTDPLVKTEAPKVELGNIPSSKFLVTSAEIDKVATGPAIAAESVINNPYQKTLQELSLAYVLKNDKAFFDANYSGVAQSGYLLDKQGKETSFLPSQITGSAGESLEQQARQTTAGKEKPDSLPEAARVAQGQIIEKTQAEQPPQGFKAAEQAVYWEKKVSDLTKQAAEHPDDELLGQQLENAQQTMRMWNRADLEKTIQPTEAPEQPKPTTSNGPDSLTPSATEQASIEKTSVISPAEQLAKLSGDLSELLGTKKLSVELYRTTDGYAVASFKDEKGRGLSAAGLFEKFPGEEAALSEQLGTFYLLSLKNPEVFDQQPTATERMSLAFTRMFDRLSSAVQAKATETKAKSAGLWERTKGWLGRAKEQGTAIVQKGRDRFEAYQKDRSKKQTKANYDKWASNFNLLSPEVAQTDKTLAGLSREISSKSETVIKAWDAIGELKTRLDELKQWDVELGQAKLIRELERKQITVSGRIATLTNQLERLRTDEQVTKQELDRLHQLESGKTNTVKPANLGAEVPDTATEQTPDSLPAAA